MKNFTFLTITLLTLFFNNVKAQTYCIPLCDATNGYITNVTIGNNVNNSSGAQPYSDFTSLVALASAGQQLPISVTCDPAILCYIGIWVDWNNNGSFNDAGDTIYSAYMNSNTISQTINVPVNTSGFFRLRVATFYNQYPDPCMAMFHYGETEDYTIGVLDLNQLNIFTAPVTSHTASTISLGGNIISDGGLSVITRGICWNTTGNPTTNDSKTTVGSGTGVFACDLIGLLAATKYYIRAYVTNANGTFYGNSILASTAFSYCTAQNGYSTSYYIQGVTVGSISNMNYTYNLYGYSDYTNLATTMTRGTSYPITVYFDNQNTLYGNVGIWADWNGDGNFTADEQIYNNYPYATTLTTNITPPANAANGNIRLRVRTGYYYNLAACGDGIASGETEDYTIVLPKVQLPPVLQTLSVSETSGVVNCISKVLDDQGANVTERGICWNTTGNPTIADHKVASGSTGMGVYTTPVSGLSGNPTVYMCAYATNSAGTSYGNVLTINSPQTVNVDNYSYVVTNNSVDVPCYIYDNGGLNPTVYGLVYSTSPTLSIGGTGCTTVYSNQGFVKNNGYFYYNIHLSGLTRATQYYVESFSTNALGTTYSGSYFFITNVDPPTVVTNDALSITTTTATIGGNITDNGGGTTPYNNVYISGILLSLFPNPEINFDEPVKYNTSPVVTSGNYSFNVSSLLPGTVYHIRSFATNPTATSYGVDKTFTTTAIAPSVTTVLPYYTPNSITFNGNITSNGGGTITESGFVYSLTTNPLIGGGGVTKLITSPLVTAGTFNATVSSLTPGTTYYFKAYAINAAGTTYGNQFVVTTNTAPPTTQASGLTFSSITTNSLNLNWTRGDGDKCIVFAKQTTSGSPAPLINTTYNGSAAFGSGSQIATSGWYCVYNGTGNLVNVTGLTSSMPYRFAVYEYNGTAGNESYLLSESNDNINNQSTDGTCQPSSFNYTFTSTFGSFIPLSGGTAMTDPYGEVNIGFTFKYNGLEMTKIGASQNGCLTTNQNLSEILALNYLSYIPEIIAPLWDNHTSNTRSYQTTGTAPNRVFTFEWLNCVWNNTSASPTISFQVRLYETSNIIEYIYRQEGGAMGYYVAGSIGLSSAGINGSGYANFYALQNTSSNPTITTTTETHNLNIKPTTGQIYRFTPSFVTKTQASNITLGNVTNNSVQIAWNKGDGLNSLVYIAKLKATSDLYPADNYTVPANNSISGAVDWNCIYNGTGNSVTAYNLAGAEQYQIRVYTSNCQPGSEKYILSPAVNNPYSFITTPSTPQTTILELYAGLDIINVHAKNTNYSGSDITQSGVVIGTSPNPTIGGTGCTAIYTNPPITSIYDYFLSFNNLQLGKAYHVSSFAVNAFGVGYCPDEIVNTLPAADFVQVSNITGTSVTATGDLSRNNGQITECGMVYGTSPNPTIETATQVIANPLVTNGTFNVNLTGLTFCTNYYICAYAKNASGVSYSSQATFRSGAIAPSMFTYDISRFTLTATTATLAGSIWSTNCGTTIENGFLLSTTQNAMYGDNGVIKATISPISGSGDYNVTATGLIPTTTYYVKAYAINEGGIGYGSEVSILELPLVSMVSITNVTANSMTVNCNIVNGSPQITASGICYGLTGAPDITSVYSNIPTSPLVTSGQFSATLTGLVAGQRYHVRAFAYYEVTHVSYSDEFWITFPGSPTTNNVLNRIFDEDIFIGSIPALNNAQNFTFESWVYPTTTNALSIISSPSFALETQPGGMISVKLGNNIYTNTLLAANTWTHLALVYDGTQATNDEKLKIYVNGNSISVPFNYGDVPDHLPSSSLSWWYLGSDNAHYLGSYEDIRFWNISRSQTDIQSNMNAEFTTMQTGLVSNLKFNQGTANGNNSSINQMIDATPNGGDATWLYAYKTGTFSNIINGSPITGGGGFFTATPVVNTLDVSNLTPTTATINGLVKNHGYPLTTESGLVWSTSPNPLIGGSGVTKITSSPLIYVGTLTSNLTGLTQGVTYHYKAYATNATGTSYGDEKIFVIPFPVVISQQPTAQTSCLNGSASFTVQVTGTNPVYQWRKNTVNISGQNSNSLSLSNLTSNDAANYDCVISNSLNSQTTNSVSLTVGINTQINTQLVSQTVNYGAVVNFTISATGTNLQYQWRQNTNNINGANSPTYTVNFADIPWIGSYDCIVSGSCGSQTSNAATLNLNLLPQTITFGNLAITTYTYGDQPFTVSATSSSGLTVTFTSSDATVATCTGTNGATITILKAGTCTINANQAGNGQYLPAQLTGPTITINKAIPVISWSNPTDIVYGTLLSSTQLNATANVAGSNFAYLPNAGTKLNAGNNQNLTVTFTPDDAIDYTTASKTVQINVSKAIPVITWSNPADIVYSTALSSTQLNASTPVSGSFAYLPPANTVLGAGNGQILNVSFTSLDANYTNTIATASINVTKASLNVIADNISKTYLDAIPTLTFHFSGFVNGDQSSVISGAPALSTTATQSSPLGTYPINISIGNVSASNYSFNFVNATLTVIPIVTIWNGTAWSKGLPVGYGISAQINANYTVGVSVPATSLSIQDLTISPNAILYVKQGFSLTVNGNFINNGGIVLQGDATSTPTGSFICYGTESGTGTYTAQRNITSSGIQHYVSSPMPNQTNAVFAPYYSFNTGNGTTWTTYTGVLANMTGYAVQYSVNTKMSTFTGTSPFNSGNQQINVNGASVMFMAGNPYPSAIDWVKIAGLTQTNISNTFYIRDVGRNVTCNLTTCAGGVFATDRFIPAMKGFLIKTGTATTGTFKMDNTVLTHATTAYWKDENTLSNIVRLKTTGGSYQGDEAVVYFDEFASNGIDNNDGDKLFEQESYYTHLFTLTEDNHPLALNVTPAVKTMPLVFQCGIAGSYSIEASELKFENGNTVFLEDLQNGNIVNLSNGAYNFAYTNTSNPYNFILHFAATSSIKPHIEGSINVYANKNLIYIQNTFSSNAEVVVYNTLGREVKRLPITGNYNTIEMNVVPGAYMVKVINGSNVVTKKVLIN